MKKIKEHHGHDHEKLNCYELLVEVMDLYFSITSFLFLSFFLSFFLSSSSSSSSQLLMSYI